MGRRKYRGRRRLSRFIATVRNRGRDRWGSWLSKEIAAFTIAALLTGHLLGGPNPSDRASLAIACASRHIGLALLIAANARGQHALELVVAYLLASAVVTIPYVLWIKKRTVQVRRPGMIQKETF